MRCKEESPHLDDETIVGDMEIYVTLRSDREL